MSQEQENITKYGELIVLGYNGLLPNGDDNETKGHFSLYQGSEANGVKPSTVHMDCDPQASFNTVYQHACFTLSPTSMVVVEYAPDSDTDMFQIGRSKEISIDFRVTETVPDSQIRDTISLFACRIICQRSPPYAAQIYAAGFDSKKNNICLGEKAVKWKTPDGQMDGLTTNGVLVMQPLHGFTQNTMKPGLWREISVCGNVFTHRETAWDQQQGEMVDGESQELVDGSLIDLCGVTLLWRTARGLKLMPTIDHLDVQRQELYAGRTCFVYKAAGIPKDPQRDVFELTLDEDTAHRELSLSENNRKVTHVREDQKYPDNNDRFKDFIQVMCRESLTASCYWEVEWSGQVEISVTYKGINRQGDDSEMGYNDKSWSLSCNGDNPHIVWHNMELIELPVSPSSRSGRVAVYVDWPAGTVSFYTVSSDTLTHLHTFRSTFTEPLYAGFSVWGSDSSVSVCQREEVQ